MKNDYLDLKKSFFKDGFFLYKNFISKAFAKNVINDVNKSKDTVKYFDKYFNLRRIEKLYDKGEYLKSLDIQILLLLKNIFHKDFVIFKDKFNAKPPGGDGFFAHYDGVFHFIDSKNKKKNGWYEYGDFFINVLIALDKCNKINGSLELAKAHKGNFKKLLKNTKNDGTPAIKSDIESRLIFKLINLEIGDIVIFSNKCPHRSKKNRTKKQRRILYYTYSLKKNGSKYLKYFKDKEKSKNLLKALNEK